MGFLKDNCVADNLAEVMCRSTISVNWLGGLFDGYSNQQLEIPAPNKSHRYLSTLLTQNPAGDDIAISDHCYGCTAGQGSNCGGDLEKKAIENIAQHTAKNIAV